MDALQEERHWCFVMFVSLNFACRAEDHMWLRNGLLNQREGPLTPGTSAATYIVILLQNPIVVVCYIKNYPMMVRFSPQGLKPK